MTPETDLNDFPALQQKESIQLERNSRGYNWVIKLLGNPISEETLNRVDEINARMQEKYGISKD